MPLDFVGYCRGCHYNLRGLAEPRCPECGRTFDPARADSYDLTPVGGVRAALPRAARWAGGSDGDSFRSFFPPGVADRLTTLERRVRRLSWENAELERRLNVLLDLLVHRQLLTPEEVAAVLPPLGLPEGVADDPAVLRAAESLGQVVDDRPLSEDDVDVDTAALAELQRAAARQAGTGPAGVPNEGPLRP
ncbi:MAG TPA: hypothetical protein VF796_20270 [Humisphaera sp.]